MHLQQTWYTQNTYKTKTSLHNMIFLQNIWSDKRFHRSHSLSRWSTSLFYVHTDFIQCRLRSWVMVKTLSVMINGPGVPREPLGINDLTDVSFIMYRWLNHCCKIKVIPCILNHEDFALLYLIQVRFQKHRWRQGERTVLGINLFSSSFCSVSKMLLW